MHKHISSPSDCRRELEGRIEQDDQLESDDVALEQHLARVRVAAAGAIQKGHKREGCNAVQGVALTVQCGRDGAPLLGVQQGSAAGWAGRTHDSQHVMSVACGLADTGGSREFVGGGGQEEKRTQDELQMHGYDLDHIDLGVCDKRTVKHGFKICTQPTASFNLVVLTQHLMHTHTRLPTLANTHAYIFTCVAY